MSRTGYPLPGSRDYRVIRDAVGSLASAASNGTYLGYPGGFLLSSTPASAIAVMRIDPALWAPPHGHKTKLRVKGLVVTNGSVAPGNITFTFRLQAIATIAGAGGALPNVTLGSVVPGSNGGQVTNPGAAAIVPATGDADFAPPAAGDYALVCNLSGAIAANANMQVMAQLLRRWSPGDG